jgi:FkbM family methyltransferase
MIKQKMKYLDEAHEKEDNIKEYINNLEKGSIFYDLGANLGWFAIYAASIGLKTYAFEVDDNNFLGLEANSKQFDFPDLHLFNVGIADTKRSVILRKYDNDIGSHRKTMELDDFAASDRVISYNHTKLIDVDSLDNIIQERNVKIS